MDHFKELAKIELRGKILIKELAKIELRGKILKTGEMFCFRNKKKLNSEQTKNQDLIKNQIGKGPFLLSKIICIPRGGFPLWILYTKDSEDGEIGASSEYFEKSPD